MKNIAAAGATLAVLLMAQPSFAANDASINNSETLNGSVLGLVATPIVITVETTKLGVETAGKVLQASGEGLDQAARSGGRLLNDVAQAVEPTTSAVAQAGYEGTGKIIELGGKTTGRALETSGDIALNTARTSGGIVGDVVKLVYTTGEGLADLTTAVIDDMTGTTKDVTASDANVEINDKQIPMTVRKDYLQLNQKDKSE